jgi:hypothetical protein
MDEKDDELELVARLPGSAVEGIAGVEVVGWRSKVIDGEQGETLQGERKR